MSDCRTEGCLYPPAFTVHWPGSTGLMCLPCTERARGAARAMGFGLPVEPWPVAASVFREPLTNPGPQVPLPEHPPAPNSEDLVDLELDRLRAENAELRRALAAVVPMAREADPTGCAAEVVEAEGALGMSVGQAMDYYRTQVEASARVELADLRARLEASEQDCAGWRALVLEHDEKVAAVQAKLEATQKDRDRFHQLYSGASVLLSEAETKLDASVPRAEVEATFAQVRRAERQAIGAQLDELETAIFQMRMCKKCSASCPQHFGTCNHALQQIYDARAVVKQ